MRVTPEFYLVSRHPVAKSGLREHRLHCGNLRGLFGCCLRKYIYNMPKIDLFIHFFVDEHSWCNDDDNNNKKNIRKIIRYENTTNNTLLC